MAGKVLRDLVTRWVFVGDNTALKGFNREVDNSKKNVAGLGGTFRSVESGMMRLTAILGIGGLSFGGVLRGIMGPTLEFQEALVRTAANAGATKSSFGVMSEDMTRRALALSTKLNIAAKDIVGPGFLSVIQQGIRAGTAEFDNLSLVGAQLSKVLGLDMATAVDSVATLTRAFGKDLSEVRNVADMMFYSARAGGGSVLQTMEALRLVAPTASELNQPLEDIVALLTALDQQGQRGTRAGMGLNVMMQNLGQKGGDAQKWLAAMNVQVFDVEGNYRSLIDIIRDVQRGMEGLSRQERELATGAIFGGRQQRIFRALGKDSTDAIDALRKALHDSSGSLEAGVEVMTNNTIGRWRGALNDLRNTAIDIGQDILPQLTEGIGELRSKITENKEELAKLGQHGVKIGGELIENMDLIATAFEVYIGVKVFQKLLMWGGKASQLFAGLAEWLMVIGSIEVVGGLGSVLGALTYILPLAATGGTLWELGKERELLAQAREREARNRQVREGNMRRAEHQRQINDLVKMGLTREQADAAAILVRDEGMEWGDAAAVVIQQESAIDAELDRQHARYSKIARQSGQRVGSAFAQGVAEGAKKEQKTVTDALTEWLTKGFDVETLRDFQAFLEHRAFGAPSRNAVMGQFAGMQNVTVQDNREISIIVHGVGDPESLAQRIKEKLSNDLQSDFGIRQRWLLGMTSV